jgi:hypothetical protein
LTKAQRHIVRAIEEVVRLGSYDWCAPSKDYTNLMRGLNAKDNFQEETMPNANPEAAAVEAAYEAQVQMLFKTLVANLVDEPVSGQTDRQSLDKFVTGFEIAKRAKQLALSAVVPGSGASRPTRLAASGRRKTK